MDYIERVDVLDNFVRKCMYISKGYAGIKASTSRHYYASVAFHYLVTKGVSLAILMPHTPWAKKKRIEHWDYASVAGIVRTMLEIRIAFFYLCVDSCTEHEWQVRWNLFNLHDCVTRISLFNAIGDLAQQEALSAQAEELKCRLRSNEYFQSFEPGLQKKFANEKIELLVKKAFSSTAIADTSPVIGETVTFTNSKGIQIEAKKTPTMTIKLLIVKHRLEKWCYRGCNPRRVII